MASLAETITKISSFQTYFTIKLLVDKPLVQDAFKAYAYFRWLDDQVDLHCRNRRERLRFTAHQKTIIDRSYRHQTPSKLRPEERLMVQLIASNPNPSSKLGSFILNFFKIIEFDAARKDSTVSQKQLDWYSQTLSQAVTDGIEYFINTAVPYPTSPDHYLAGLGAHLSHMLRDYQEDVPNGFINIPQEYLTQHHLQPTQVNTPAFQAWVQHQVGSARHYFQAGHHYIKALPVLRGKIAATWYCARFEGILNTIEQDGYRLRPCYSCKQMTNYLKMILIAIKVIIRHYAQIIRLSDEYRNPERVK